MRVKTAGTSALLARLSVPNALCALKSRASQNPCPAFPGLLRFAENRTYECLRAALAVAVAVAVADGVGWFCAKAMHNVGVM